MAATNRYRNVSNVTWTPSGGSLVTLTGIKSASYDEGNQVLEESADFDAYPTVAGVTMSNPKITLDTLDAFALFATLAGQKGTLAITFRDHSNGATTAGGAKIVTATNAFIGPRQITSNYNTLAHQSLTFQTFSSDGATHPISVSAA